MKKIQPPKKLWLSAFHFLKINEGKTILWDYKNHTQFEIEKNHLGRLREYSNGSVYSDSALDQEILQSGILTEEPPNTKWGWDWLAHIYHYGTCHPLVPQTGSTEEQKLEYAQSYANYCASLSSTQPEIDVIKGGERISLPAPNLEAFESTSLWESLAKRRTCRDFDASSISVSDIADLMFSTFGDQKTSDPSMPQDVSVYGYHRTSPSAGGLQCTEPYLWAINIEGLDAGLYHYLSRSHQLEVIAEKPPDHPIGTYLCNQHWANDMAFAIIMTCRMEKMWWKYPHSRAYRPMLMDVGHLSQTLSLCITAKGLHPWITGYFHDKEIADLLLCENETEQPILLVGAGKGTGSSLDREIRKKFSNQGESK